MSLKFHVIACILVAFINASADWAAPVDVADGSVSGVSALDAADFDGDGLMDVAVFEGGQGSSGRVTVAWFEQQTDGSWIRHEFGHANIIGTTSLNDFVGAAKCGEMTGDGRPDVVVCVDGHGAGPIIIYLFENPGGADVYDTWPKHVIANMSGKHANDVAIEDMDGDGKNDVIVRHKVPDDVKVVFQNSKSDWDDPVVVGTRDGEGLSVGDLNGDDRPDVSVSGDWYKAPSSPRTQAYTKYTYTNYTNRATKEDIDDLNGDGRNDIVLSPAESYTNYGTPGEIHDLAWFECPANPEGTSNWTKHLIKQDYNDASFVRIADFDNDGDKDIVNARTWNGTYIRIYYNDNGDFSESELVIEGKGGYSGAVGDIDGDGDMDIVAENTYSGRCKPWFYENLLSSGATSTSVQAPLPALHSTAQIGCLTDMRGRAATTNGETAAQLFFDGSEVRVFGTGLAMP